jgi:cell wall-associated NlpC family hydrolase
MSDFFQYKTQVAGLFPVEAIEAAKAHAVAEYPKEACGFIAAGVYHPCANIAPDPVKDFVIAEAEWFPFRDTLEAVVHSHTNGQIYPSERDMAQQLATDVPWIILALNESGSFHEPVVWGDSLPEAPLLERPFVWGVFDCYTLVRDYYRQAHGLVLPQVPREDGWWRNGQDLYQDYLKKMGFQVIDRSKARPGDGFLIAIESKGVLNHAGILVENSMILHHLPNRLSRREPAGIWAYGADLWVRHPQLNQPEASDA